MGLHRKLSISIQQSVARLPLLRKRAAARYPDTSMRAKPGLLANRRGSPGCAGEPRLILAASDALPVHWRTQPSECQLLALARTHLAGHDRMPAPRVRA